MTFDTVTVYTFVTEPSSEVTLSVALPLERSSGEATESVAPSETSTSGVTAARSSSASASLTYTVIVFSVSLIEASAASTSPLRENEVTDAAELSVPDSLVPSQATSTVIGIPSSATPRFIARRSLPTVPPSIVIVQFMGSPVANTSSDFTTEAVKEYSPSTLVAASAQFSMLRLPRLISAVPIFRRKSFKVMSTALSEEADLAITTCLIKPSATCPPGFSIMSKAALYVPATCSAAEPAPGSPPSPSSSLQEANIVMENNAAHK